VLAVLVRKRLLNEDGSNGAMYTVPETKGIRRELVHQASTGNSGAYERRGSWKGDRIGESYFQCMSIQYVQICCGY